MNDHPTHWSEEKVVFLPWSHYNTDRPWAALSFGLEDRSWGNGDFVHMEIVREQPNVCKSVKPDGIHPRVLKELVVVLA